MKVTLLSVLVPVYNEEKCIGLFYKSLINVLNNLSCPVEILFVNDGSSDNTLSVIRDLQELDPRIAYVDLSRNYGKEIAMAAGIDFVHGDALVLIDADLQDPPELIPLMLNEIENGYDDVYACRSHRHGESWFKKWSSEKYYQWMKRISNVPIQENTGDFRMFSKKAVDALLLLKERERNMKGLFSFIGFKKKAIYFERKKRVAGTTKWNYFSLVDLAIKGFTSFSVIPLRIVSCMGILVSFIAFIYLLITVIKALLQGDPVAGYPSLMSVMLFLGGVTLLALGIIGEYIGIIYNETKKRPIYLINEYRNQTNVGIKKTSKEPILSRV